jgi:hypothetical protein
MPSQSNLLPKKRRPKLIKFNVKWVIISDTNEIQRIITDILKTYSNKSENQESMFSFTRGR